MCAEAISGPGFLVGEPGLASFPIPIPAGNRSRGTFQLNPLPDLDRGSRRRRLHPRRAVGRDILVICVLADDTYNRWGESERSEPESEG